MRYIKVKNCYDCPHREYYIGHSRTSKPTGEYCEAVTPSKPLWEEWKVYRLLRFWKNPNKRSKWAQWVHWGDTKSFPVQGSKDFPEWCPLLTNEEVTGNPHMTPEKLLEYMDL